MRALVESGWTITFGFPVESEFSFTIAEMPQPLAPLHRLPQTRRGKPSACYLVRLRHGRRSTRGEAVRGIEEFSSESQSG